MPAPRKNETREKFIARCIPYVIKEDDSRSREQAAAICFSIWRRKDKKK